MRDSSPAFWVFTIIGTVIVMFLAYANWRCGHDTEFKHEVGEILYDIKDALGLRPGW